MRAGSVPALLRRWGAALAVPVALACACAFAWGAAGAADTSADEDDEDRETQALIERFGAGFAADADSSDSAHLDTEPLLVHPLWIYADPGMGPAMQRMPAPARQWLSQAGERTEVFDFAAAQEALGQARRITQQALGDADAANLMVLLQLGYLEQARQDWTAALAHYRAGVALAERSLGAQSPWLVALLWFEAGVLLNQGDLPAARAVAERASAAVTARGGAFDERIALLNNNAVLRLAAGDFAAAQRGFDAALEQLATQAAGFGPHIGFRPRILSNLGLLHWYRGDSAGALHAYRSALAERAPWRLAGGWSERAELILGRTAAQELDAIVTLERSAPPTAARLGLTALFERKGALLDRQARGMASLRESAVAPRAERPSGIGAVLGNLFNPQATAQRQLEAMFDDSLRGADRELLRRHQQAQADRVALEQQRPATDAEAAERDRAIARADRRLQQIGAQVSQQAAARTMREQMLKQLREAGAGAAVALPASPEEGMRQAAAAHFDKLSRERDALPGAVRAAISAGAVLVEMLVYRPLAPRPSRAAGADRPARYGAYVLRRDSPETHFIDLGEAQSVDRLIVDLRRNLARPTSLARAREAARKLDAVVMQPLRPLIGSATNVLLAPEGLLNLVPFGALVDEDGRYGVERHQFNYLASGRDLLRMAGSPPARTPPLIIADPAFGAFAAPSAPAAASAATASAPRSRELGSVTFDPLPGTAAEAAAIRPTLAGATLLTGAAATESALKAARGPKLLHLATHGYFLESDQRGPNAGLVAGDAMLRSGLVLAGVNMQRTGNDDGVLTALEASGLDLAGTQLVVLSACDTGLGEVQNGEGVFGLRRAFVVAGAQTLVMSLWEVEDDATKRLMVDYYSRLSRGEGRIEALRRAQLAMLGDAQSAHPFYWAAFIASGQAGALR